eukprot:1783754-Prymnesium_polylepis.1
MQGSPQASCAGSPRISQVDVCLRRSNDLLCARAACPHPQRRTRMHANASATSVSRSQPPCLRVMRASGTIAASYT